mgnify:CR=1 FL=1
MPFEVKENGEVIKATMKDEDITGVGYGICSFYPQDENEERNIRLLKQAMEEYIRGKVPTIKVILID